VYRTVRGLVLSGSRALPTTGRHGGIAALAAPLRVSTMPRVRAASELAAPVLPLAPAPADAAGLDDAAALYDARRYSEPND
jgi:hypothetical protein